MRTVVVNLADRRPVWTLPGWVPEEIRAALPRGWRLEMSEEPADGSGDGDASASRSLLELARDCEIYLGYGLPAELVRAAPALSWAHSGAAGVRGSLTPELKASEIVFTNSAGIHARPMAETALAMLLHFFRGLDFAVRNQAMRRWSALPYLRAESPVRELGSATVGIVGYGGIGRALVCLLTAFGSSVLAVRRSVRGRRAVGADTSSGADESDDGATRNVAVFGPEALPELLAASDAVVVAVPDTAETRGLIDGAALAAMKPGAVLVNVSRGGVVDERALVDALRSGRLRGAGLDVFEHEPLSRANPLWDLDNVILTPHVSAVTRGFWRRETDLILHNLRRYLAGAPLGEWRNVVDPKRGY